MKYLAISLAFSAALLATGAPVPTRPLVSADNSAKARTTGENPAIDMTGFLRVSQEAAKHRATRRLSEVDFLKMSREPGTIVLDARSRQKYDLLHIKGAVNLSFPDITVASLQRTMPDKSTRILIYCNNNFINSERAFESKLPTASLNLSTYISLFTYGYRNVYELGPVLDPKQSKLTFEPAPQKP